MKVIVHKDITMKFYSVNIEGLDKVLKKLPSVCIVLEDVLPFIAAAGDVIDSIWVLDSEGSCHNKFISYHRLIVNNEDLTPLLQLEKDLITAKIVKGKNFNNTACHFLEQNLKKTLGDNVKITFEFVQEIPREKSGKIRLIKSYLH